MQQYHLRILDKTNIYPQSDIRHAGDSGIDLYFPEDVIVPGNNTCYINLQISCEMTKNDTELSSYYLYPRSSISKTPLILANSVGIIDAGYRGDIIAAVRNLHSEDYKISKGDRLFQICAPDLSKINYSIVSSLSESDRGAGGFGSTGK
jgi:dUTP pyrophosphatase